jgi:cob(I)alamin adenosyltransferase
MSIITKTGDDGTTGLMYNRRVPKNHPRVEAYGTVDELNAALGLARARADDDFARESLLGMQKDLVILMGELATLPEDLERYRKDGYAVVTPEMTLRLEKWAGEIEGQNITVRGWATPGSNEVSAALDLARTIGRRAERCVVGLLERQPPERTEILRYLNRLTDLLWLLARWQETKNLA